MAIKTFRIQKTSQMCMSKYPPSYSVPPQVDYYSTASSLPPPLVDYHLPTEQSCPFPPLDSSPYIRTSGAEMSLMSPLAPSSLSPSSTQFGCSTSDDFSSFSSGYDDDSSKILEDKSDDSTHPWSPIKPRNSAKTNGKGSKSKRQ